MVCAFRAGQHRAPDARVHALALPVSLATCIIARTCGASASASPLHLHRISPSLGIGLGLHQHRRSVHAGWATSTTCTRASSSIARHRSSGSTCTRRRYCRTNPNQRSDGRPDLDSSRRLSRSVLGRRPRERRFSDVVCSVMFALSSVLQQLRELS